MELASLLEISESYVELLAVEQLINRFTWGVIYC